MVAFFYTLNVSGMKLTTELQSFLSSWSTFNGNSLTIKNDGFRKLIGDFAEYMFQLKYPEAFRISETDRESDFVLRHKRIDVKVVSYSTNNFSSCEVKVPAYQKNFNVDWYCFFIFSKVDRSLYFAGWKQKTDFFNEAIFRSKGEIIQPFNFKVIADCYTIHVSKLIKGAC